MSFWFRVEVCWFSMVVPAVENTVWRLFQNVVIPQSILKSVAATASDMIMLLAVLYATMMFSLSSWMMRTTTVLMRMSVQLSQDKSHQRRRRGRLSFTLTLRYVRLFFLLCLPSHTDCVWHLSNVPHLFMMLRTSSFDEIKKVPLVISIEINQITQH